MIETLYISYTGLLEPLGESQVLAYVLKLASKFHISVVSFEKKNDWEDVFRREMLADRLARAGVNWRPLRYHKRVPPIATAFDLMRGYAVCKRLVALRGVRLVHARGYISALVALRLQRKCGVRFVFDMRGFWPDERVDAGVWSRSSPLYRLFKQLERRLLSSADAVVSLTRAGVDAMREFAFLQGRAVHFTVIPTCADLDRFHPPDKQCDRPFTLGYVGNVSGWYRFEPVVATFRAILAMIPDARFLIVNRGQHSEIRRRLAAQEIPEDCIDLRTLDFRDVPEAIRDMDATAFFIEPTISKQASAPTKLAEFLGCGVPCLVNSGVGDMDRIVRGSNVGVVVDEICNAAAAGAAERLVSMARDPAVRQRCVETAQTHFSLDAGVEQYRNIYDELSAN